MCTPARAGIGADKLSLGFKFRFSERRGHTVAIRLMRDGDKQAHEQAEAQLSLLYFKSIKTII